MPEYVVIEPQHLDRRPRNFSYLTMILNPLAPYLPAYPGPFRVGTIEVEVNIPKDLQRTFGQNVVKTLLVRLFYPTSASHGKKPRWVGEGGYTIRGYASFLGLNHNVLKAGTLLGLNFTEIPAFVDSPLLAPGTGSKWPTMVFSHGLGGTRNAYSQICGSMSSGGLVVVAIEHRDNSAAISVVHSKSEGEAVSKSPEVVDYVSIKDSTPQNIKKRREQIAQRAYETRLALELCRTLNAGNGVLDGEVSVGLKDKFNDALDTGKGRFIAAGHSFGAATAVGACKEKDTFVDGGSEYPMHEEFRAAILFDPWMEVLADSAKVPLRVPTIAIASQAFHDWGTNFRAVQSLLKDVHQSRLFWVNKSAHLSQSDFQLLFPRLTKYAFRAECDPSLAMELNVRAAREFMRQLGIGEEQKDETIFDGNNELHELNLKL